jgi:type IX secretion system PorP/SprF family membrane protein
MKKYLLAIFFISAWAIGDLRAQDAQFSQFYAMPLYLNPGFTGTAKQHRITSIHRIQWPNLPKAFNTTAVSYDYNMRHLNSGFGMMVVRDKAGTGGLMTTNVGGFYAYKIQLERGWIISPGLQFSYTMRNLDFSKLTMHDQLAFNSGTMPGTGDPDVRSMQGVNFFDFGTGLLVYNKLAWFGASVYHLNEPNQSFTQQDDRMPAKYSAHGGVRIPLYNGPMERERISSIAPSFIYKKQGHFQQLDVGAHFHYNPIMAGFWYRGLPLVKNDYDYLRQDAVSFLFGLRFEQFDVGYSYDFTVSSMGPASGGSHEIALMYQFNAAQSRKVKRKEKFIPCPTF